MIQPHNLACQLISLRFKIVKNKFVNRVESVFECFVHIGNLVYLGVVWTHNSTFLANQCFSGFTKEIKRLVMNATDLLNIHLTIS